MKKIYLLLVILLVFNSAFCLAIPSEDYNLIDDMFKVHMNYFFSNFSVDSYGLPATAYRAGQRSDYTWSNPTEWGYLLQAYIAASERNIITKNDAVKKINISLNTISTLQNTPGQNYNGLFYAYYYVFDSSGNSIFPYHDANINIPSIDDGLFYASLLITEGWAKTNGYSEIENKARTIKNKMNFSIFLFTSGSDTYMAHTINANTGILSPDKWDVYSDEGGLMSIIAYVSGSIDLNTFKKLTNSQMRDPASWNGFTVKESAWFNAMFTWGVRSIAGFKVIGTNYSVGSLVPATKAHLAYGDSIGFTYPGFSDAMTQPNGVGKYVPPNLNSNQADMPSVSVPHAFFIPFNVLPDLDDATISNLTKKISILKSDSAGYYHNSSLYPFGFEVVASPYANQTGFSGLNGRNIFETLSEGYTVLSLFNGLQNIDNNDDFYDIAKNVPGYESKVNDILNSLYNSSQTNQSNQTNQTNCTIPYDGMTITTSTVFCKGSYYLPNGIRITSGNVVLDCNGAEIYGNKTYNYNGILAGSYQSGNIIKNCIIKQFYKGIFNYNGYNHGYFNNTFFNNSYAIWLESSHNDIIRGNNISKNSDSGIVIYWYNYGEIIELNNINGNLGAGIWVDWGSNNNIIRNNNIRDNQYGILAGGSFDRITQKNNYSENNIINNSYGVYLLQFCNGSFILKNNIINNSYGAYITGSNNIITTNNFLNNSIQAYNTLSNTNNSWNYTGNGNYWSNYDTPAEGCNDLDSDGKCDTPYSISGTGNNKDYYPFTKPNGWISPKIKNNTFVTVNGTNFYMDGKPFYFAGANAYFLWYGNLTCNSTNPAASGECVKEALDDAVGLNFTVIRTWGYGETYQKGYCFQPSAGVYDEATFAHFDRVINESAKRGLKLIVTLSNNWNDFGGMCQYARWCGIPNANICNPNSGQPGTPAHDAFYTNSCTKNLYKNYVSTFLNRVNTLTGVKYKDDPTILAWELANEPRAMTDQTGQTLRNWISEMSAYVKSIDSKHLVASGEDGFYVAGSRPEYGYHGEDGADYILDTDLPNIDFGSFHAYDWWGNENNLQYWIQKHGEDSRYILGKPTVAGEIDASKDDAYIGRVYSKMESSKINGDLIWMICPTNFAESGGRCIRYPEDTLASVAINHSNYMNNFLPSANTAPVLSSISNITVNAGDTIVIAANASDLEGDTLSYNIDSSFFDKTGNIFTWQTSLYSAGNYSFRVTVNDGNLGDSQLVFVKVIGLKYNCTMPMDNMLITNNTLFCPGTYTILNSINVNKAGVLINCNGTILKGNGSGTGFSLQTGNITITNCNFEKLGNGILSQYNHRFGYFIGNNFLNCGYGIYILESSYNTLTNNAFINSTIRFHNNDYSLVKNNTISNQGSNGIYLHKSDYCNFTNNIITKSVNGFTGTDGNIFDIFENNTLERNTFGFNLGWGGWHNTYKNNKFINNSIGWYHHPSDYGYVLNNTFTKNEFIINGNGIDLGNCNGFNISDNLFLQNNRAFYISGSYGQNNTIYHNNMIDSISFPATDQNSNYWNINHEGNYWSNYDTPAEGCNDLDSDGKCDTPYSISGTGNNKDYYPFTKPDGWIKPVVLVNITKGWNLFSIKVGSADTNINKTIKLNKGWNLIGYSGNNQFLWYNGLISDGTSNKNISSAASSNWIQSTIYYFENGAYKSVPGDRDYLTENKGYWLYSLKDNLTLILPNACGYLCGVYYDWISANAINGSQTKRITDAQAAGWLQSTIYYFNQSYKLVPGDSMSIYPWMGYWIYSNYNLTLKVGG